MKTAIALILAAALTGCAITGAVLGPTPEAQIVNGANTIAAGATLGTVLLRNDRITVVQAKSYRAILGTADSHLKAADTALLACRKSTGSSSKSNPDPCKASVEADIRLAVSIAEGVQNTLKAKE